MRTIPPDESSVIMGHLLFAEKLFPSGVLDWPTPIIIMKTHAFVAINESVPDHSCQATRTIAGPILIIGSDWLSAVTALMLVHADHDGDERFRFRLEYLTRELE